MVLLDFRRLPDGVAADGGTFGGVGSSRLARHASIPSLMVPASQHAPRVVAREGVALACSFATSAAKAA